jgi:hypothetical protein
MDLARMKGSLDSNAPALSTYVSWHKSHSILYFVGLLFFLILVILEELFGFLTKIGKVLGIFINCCSKREQRIDQVV